MIRQLLVPICIVTAVMAFASCVVIDSGLPEPIFTLPEGEAAAGRAAFQKFNCYSCHEVKGEKFPKPVAQPPVPIRFGKASDGDMPPVYFMSAQLAESIINPSHRVTPWKDNVRSGSGSRMGDYTEVMTVRELIDLVAFLQSKSGRRKK